MQASNLLFFKEFLMDVAVKGTNPALPVNTEKAKALAAALAQIEKQFGKGTIMRLGEGEVIEDIQVVSTGSLGLDIALGVGGLPRGRVVEIYGPESSGKTTLTLQVVAEMQKQGGPFAFVDPEHALDLRFLVGGGLHQVNPHGVRRQIRFGGRKLGQAAIGRAIDIQHEDDSGTGLQRLAPSVTLMGGIGKVGWV